MNLAKSALRFGSLWVLLGTGLIWPLSASAEDISADGSMHGTTDAYKVYTGHLHPDEYTTTHLTKEQQDFINQQIEKKNLIKFMGPDAVYGMNNPYGLEGKPVYRASAAYYDNFSYDWVDGNGVKHTSKITDRATDRNQIIALLKEVYTNPLIPGYVEDISFNVYSEVNYDIYTEDDEELLKFGTNNILPQDGGTTGNMYAYTRGTNGKWGNNTDRSFMNRNSFNITNYPAHDYYPFFIKEAPQRPINGATALMVEMKASYYGATKNENGKISYFDPTGSFSKENVNAQIDKALDFIDAVTLIPRQRYITQWGEHKTGFMFDMEGYFAKCFIVTKGSPRPDKTFGYKLEDGDGFFKVNGEDYIYYGASIFFDMFEEFSPTNEGPMSDAFTVMSSGDKFIVDHSCASIITQQHDVIMGKEDTYEQRNEKFHVNLMFYLPDYRFNGRTAMKPSDRWNNPENGTDTERQLKSPYTFYVKEYRPYFFFNQINAEIRGTIQLENENNGDETVTYAYIPVEWNSNYRTILGEDVPESFWIYRVRNGAVDPEPVPLEDIRLRQIIDDFSSNLEDYVFTEETKEQTIYKYDITMKYPNEKTIPGSLVHGFDNHVEVYVKEPFVEGDEISYVIRGTRKDSEFSLVESNIVTTALPFKADGSYFTIELNRAQSKYDIEKEQNIYSNVVDYVHIGDNNTIEGNIVLRDFYEINYTNGTAVMREGTLRVYRHVCDEDGKIMDGKSTVLYEIPSSDFLVSTKYSVPVVRIVDPITRQYEINANQSVIGDGFDPYRSLTKLRDKGFGEDQNKKVRLAMAFKLHDPDGNVAIEDLTSLKVNNLNEQKFLPFVPLAGDGTEGSGNGQLMGYFIDDLPEDFNGTSNISDVDNELNSGFVVSTAANDFNLRYKYQIVFEPEVNQGANKVSNTVEVRVPLRPVFAGYMTYTYDEIAREEDITFNTEESMRDQFLMPNNKACAMQVSNSALIKNYDIYRLRGTNLKDKNLVARVWRNSDGSFQPRVFDGDNTNDDSAQDGGIPTEANFIGKVPIKLLAEADPDDNFVVEINTVNTPDEPYRDNTYGAQWAIMPYYPSVEVTTVEMKRISDYNYEATVIVTPVNFKPEQYDDIEFLLWSNDQVKKGVYYPADSYFNCQKDAKYEWFTDTDGVKKCRITYQFTHKYKEPTLTQHVVTTNVIRMYAKIKSHHSIEPLPTPTENPQARIARRASSMSEDDYSDGFVIADAAVHYGLLGNGGTTGAEDLFTDFNSEYIYYNLNGVRVPSNDLIPGMYIRTNGIVTEKVTIH